MKFVALAAALVLSLPGLAQGRANPPAGAIEVFVPSSASAVAKRHALVTGVSAEVAAANAYAAAYWRAKHPAGLPFIMPRVAYMRDENGRALWPGPRRSGEDGGLTLTFEGFDAAYQQRLVATFDASKPFLDAILGQPYQAATVHVRNYDADIGDRDAVAGGIYLPDGGTGTPVILFAVYLAPETAVVNFIHCLALAYQGPALLEYDAWSEGFARAATMQTVRLGGVPGGLNQGTIDQIIESSYDNSPHYSWYNQPPLGNPRFIAPNLRDLPLPPGGSLGGIYLMRYKMGGTAWGKVITEFPGFLSTFLPAYYTAYDIDPSLAGDIPALKSLAQSTMDFLGGPGSTIEGRPFASWHRRQFILDTTVTRGKKVFLEPIPITSGLLGNDFGVFALWGTYFDTLQGGNETLLSGTSYPLYWDTSFARMFTSGQDDRMDIGAGFGSVTPNLPNVLGGDIWYRGTVELPVTDTIARSLLPVGAIATANNPIPKVFYGTVLGFDGAVTGGDPNVTGIVRLTLPGQPPIDASLRNGAFGADVPAPGFNAPKRATVQVIRVVNAVETVLHTSFVNTWGQALGLDIRIDDETTYFPLGGLPGGIQMFTMPVRPFETDMAVTLGQPPGQALIGRWRQDLFRYALYPSLQGFDYGRGFFTRLPAAQPGISVEGFSPGSSPLSVALQVGWNQVGSPFPDDIPFTQVTVQRAAEFPKLWADAIAAGWIDTTIFEFVPGAPDPFSGLPEGGAMNAITSFPEGKALFVRCLVAEGVTITFKPSTSMAASQTIPLAPLWRVRLAFSGLGVERSAVEIGAQSGARTGHDVGIDALLPPLWGGALQASIAGAAPLFRDMRQSGISPWTVYAEGLRVGAAYEVRFVQAAGSARPRFRVRDVESGVTVSPSVGGVYRFTARSPRHTFHVTAFALTGGAR
jgi:hypothetical protein